MNALLPWSPLLAAALLAAVGWWRWRTRGLRQRLGDEGWRLIHELKAYGAWLGLLRGECGLSAQSDESGQAAAQALRNGAAITASAFPALSQAWARLAEADRRLAPLLAHRRDASDSTMQAQPDAAARDLLDSQLDLVEELIARCQVLIGARDAVWHGTDIESQVPPSFGATTTSTG